MGSWGVGVFENDSALDWLDELPLDGTGMADRVRQTFTSAIGVRYADVDEGQWVLAAAALVSAQLPTPVELPVQLRELTFPVDDELRGLALRAVDRVLDAETSELAGLVDGVDAFAAVVDRLKGSLVG
jgi:hypothetical protein